MNSLPQLNWKVQRNGCRNAPVYSDLCLELVPFQFGTVLAAAVYMAVQRQEIKL